MWVRSLVNCSNIWCTTGTVGSYLNHPTKGKTQLFRRNVHSLHELYSILDNPRVHTDKGYHTTQHAPTRSPKRKREVACPGCGKCYCASSARASTVCDPIYLPASHCRSRTHTASFFAFLLPSDTMGDTAQHFESGRCSSCPGQDNARQAMYQYARQREHSAGANGMFTNGGQQMLTFNGAGQQDWTAGYQSGGKNYHCPGCNKGFTTVGGMLNHMQAKPSCNQSAGNLRIM